MPETSLAGAALINTPLLNKGTAFSQAERDTFNLNGLLPPHIGGLEEQVVRRLKVLRGLHTDFERYTYLRDLQDTNETLFYALLTGNLEEMLPLVYTPTVGEGCQRFSEIWRKPRGLFLSYPNRHLLDDILANPALDAVRVIVVTDGERILGLGDQGAGGMGIPIGKLALYTACGGIPPEYCLPILLDVGTNNPERLADPIYVGWRHARVSGQDYEDFVEDFVQAVMRRWPDILLQWEDFAGANADKFLARYRDRLCTFNDDIQSTASVTAATVIAALNAAGGKLRDQRIAMLGLGSAGKGIAELLVRIMVEDGLDEAEARARFYAIGRHGLLVEGAKGIHPEQRAFVRAREPWQRENETGLLEVMRHAKPGILIGTAGMAGAFSEEVVREMARHCARPIILPLSNPTSKSESTPKDLLEWTEGRAIIGTGSPFKPVQWQGRDIAIDQTNNAYIFPGMGLGILVARARRVTDAMFMAAAKALAGLSPTLQDPERGTLLPGLTQSRNVAAAIAEAVAAQAVADGVAELDSATPMAERIAAYVWTPAYRELQRKSAA